ncbi:metal ABC transporter solute-binding protein, Zn/Mn family [Acidobacteriota bacterium]
MEILLRNRHTMRLGFLILAILAPVFSGAQVVFVSIPPQAFLVERLAGDLVEVRILLPPGASPATYEPTPKQMAALDRSQLYLQIGAPFEGPVLAKVADLMPEVRIVDCRAGIVLDPIGGDGHDHGFGLLDPHIWLDPHNMKTIAATTAEALQALLPGESTTIEERLAALHDAIDNTDERVAQALAPLAGQTLLVFHPAYGYFTRRYGLIQKAVEVDGKAPSARRLAAVVEDIGQHQAAALFVQPQFSRSAAERVAGALDCELVELDPLAGDYLANLEAMADSIVRTLQ